MLQRFRLSLLLQGLTLLLLGPVCEASSLGLTVHVVPLDSDGGRTVRAHFTAITPSPCPALTGLCAAGEDCLVHKTSLPFSGTKPEPGWCVRRWQKTVPSNYSATISLGTKTEFYVSMKTEPKVRANNGRLNQPAYVGLHPPLRARVNCPHHFSLSVKDLDGDRVRCRFARPDQGECVGCTRHSFIELNEEKCMLTFTGSAAAGQYFIHLMAEDFIPVPRTAQATDNRPLSSVPVHLSLTVEESTTSCSEEPVATSEIPEEDSTLFVLPYQQVSFDVNYFSKLESVLEVAVVGPPDLFRVGFKTVGPLALMTMAWIRSENKLPRLLPVCFTVNTKSLQSEPRCVWLYQREMRTLPAGTELKCEKTEMTLVLPVSSLSDIKLEELQLNSPTCPVTYNSTHLTARISLTGCGTKTVHSGSELVYTNTLKSVRPYTMVSREPSLILPLACRIPGVQAKGPHYQINLPTEEETFGNVTFWLEIHLPGEGPLSRFTRFPQFRTLQSLPARVRREAELSPSINSTSASSPSPSSASSPSTSSTSSPPISNLSTSSASSPPISNLSTSSASSPPISNLSASSASSPPISNLSTSSASSPSIGNLSTSLISNTTTNFTDSSSGGAIGSRLNKLDLHVMSNSSIDRAELIVSNCIESATEDFAVSHPILEQGCTASSGTVEIVTTQNNTRVYRLDLSNVETQGSTMYIQCTVNLCIATLPSQKCPSLCTRTLSRSAVVGSVFTKTYSIRSGPVSLVVTTPAPKVTAVVLAETTPAPTTTVLITNAVTTQNTTSHAPHQASTVTAGVILTTISMFLQNVFLY